MKLIRRTTLRFQEGNSDKVYEVDVVEISVNRYVVNFRYGRQGKSLTEGSKTMAPVDYDYAQKLADSLLISKINKGYWVASGYDPVTRQYLGAVAHSPVTVNKTADHTARNYKMLDRLYKFAQGVRTKKEGYLEGYSLTRTIWMAGELRIPELIDALQMLADTPPKHVKNNPLFYYSLAWAAGRTGDAAALALLRQIQSQIPAHLYLFACLQVSKNHQLLLDESFDVLQAIEVIQISDAQRLDGKLGRDALQAQKQLLDYLQDQAVNLYAQDYVKATKHSQALIGTLPANGSLTTLFRVLYKMAEFLDDYTSLAVLNQRVELSQADAYHYRFNPRPSFTEASRLYLRRRLIRRLRHLAKHKPSDYVQLSCEILLQVDDNAAQTSTAHNTLYFPKLGAFNFILNKHNPDYHITYKGDWLLRENRLSSHDQTEAYPHLWTEASDALLTLWRYCKSSMVDQFAYRRLQSQSAFLSTLTQEIWLELVLRPYEKTALLALSYLSPALSQTAVMLTVLKAQFLSIRQNVLSQLSEGHFKQNPDLFVIMLMSEYEDVYQCAKDYLYMAPLKDLSGALVEALLNTTEDQQAYLVPRFQWLFTHPLQSTLEYTQLCLLLQHQARLLQHLGTILLASSDDYSSEQRKTCFTWMAQSPFAEVRAGAIALLSKLDDADKWHYQALIFQALTDEDAQLRQASQAVVANVSDRAFLQSIWTHITPYLFHTQTVDGFNQDMLALVQLLTPIHAQIDHDLLWRLLTARSKLAEQVSGVLLVSHNPHTFSIKQLALLTKNPSLAVRNWALTALIHDKARTLAHFEDALRALDNRWEDTRQQVIAFFNAQEHWSIEHIVTVCDNVYTDVQKFGRELLLRCFQEGQGETYLLRLSQHPSSHVQLFVSEFLHHYATGQVAIILKLDTYFKTVLSQVNRGRVIKDRIIAFLFKESANNQEVASMVAHLFSDQSLTQVIADRARYIKTLLELQNRFTVPTTPVKVIQPVVRSVR